jgi:hypothetical protein
MRPVKVSELFEAKQITIKIDVAALETQMKSRLRQEARIC